MRRKERRSLWSEIVGHLAVGSRERVDDVERMLSVSLRFRPESDDLLVYHVELEDGRLQVAERCVPALPVGHVIVDHHELIS